MEVRNFLLETVDGLREEDLKSRDYGISQLEDVIMRPEIDSQVLHHWRLQLQRRPEDLIIEQRA